MGRADAIAIQARTACTNPFDRTAMMRGTKDNGFGMAECRPVTYIVGADGVVRAMFTPIDMGITKDGRPTRDIFQKEVFPCAFSLSPRFSASRS